MEGEKYLILLLTEFTEEEKEHIRQHYLELFQWEDWAISEKYFTQIIPYDDLVSLKTIVLISRVKIPYFEEEYQARNLSKMMGNTEVWVDFVTHVFTEHKQRQILNQLADDVFGRIGNGKS